MSEKSESSESPRRRRRQSAPPPPPQGSVAKGAILVGVALVVGLFLLRDDSATTAQVTVGNDTGSDVNDPADGSGSDDGSGDDGSTSSSTTVPVRAPAEVKVLVANGSGINGAAGAETTNLEALGYVTATPTNAERVPNTVVYYTAGYEREAAQLADALGLAETAVASLPTPAPVDDLQLSNLLIIVGPDTASSS